MNGGCGSGLTMIGCCLLGSLLSTVGDSSLLMLTFCSGSLMLVVGDGDSGSLFITGGGSGSSVILVVDDSGLLMKYDCGSDSYSSVKLVVICSSSLMKLLVTDNDVDEFECSEFKL